MAKIRSRVVVAVLGCSAAMGLTSPPALATAPSTGFLAGRVLGGSGARVLLYAWPGQSTLAHLKAGQTVPIQLVESTNADSLGRYSLTAPAVRVSGSINFEVDALASSGVASHSFTRTAATMKQPAAVDLRPLAHSAHTAAGGIQPNDNVTKCVVTFKHTLGKVWSIVGQTYSTSVHVNEYFVYSSGASSDLGIGVSASGSYGTFTSSGTSSTESTAEISFPGQAGRKYSYFKSRFREGKFKTVCTWKGGGDSWYSSRVTNFSGGAAVVHVKSAPHTPIRYCDDYDNHSAFTLHRTHAVTWSNGLDTSSLIGVDLSAQTGYSSDAELVYTIHKNGAAVCGTGGDAGGPHPYQVVAH